MKWDRRVGSGVLAGLGIALACLMIYVLLIEKLKNSWTVDPRKIEAIEVEVYFGDRSEWRIFLEGLQAALSPPGRLGTVIAQDDDLVVVETTEHQKRIRFSWNSVRGEGETRAEVLRKARSDRPPVAVIGASNTVLTSALAESLALEHARRPSLAPILLMPWATSMAMLETHQGWTIRFCSNNRRSANLLVDALFSRGRLKPPSRALILVDASDPYSVDLARCFREAVERVAPDAELQERSDVLSTSIRKYPTAGIATPSETEQEFARKTWDDAIARPGEATWLFLPIQNEPIRRIFAALNGAAPSRTIALRGGLTVICGDSVGLTTFGLLVNALAFPIWGLSGISNLGTEPSRTLGDDVQVPAELATMVLLAIDQLETVTPSALREQILRLSLRRTDPRAFGRSIAFLPSGERAWESDDDVLYLAPGRNKVSTLTRDATGVWSDPAPVDSAGAAR